MRSLFAVRAHHPTPAVRALHLELSTSFPAERVVVVVDELHSATPKAWPQEFEIISINDRLLRDLGIRTDIVDAGWRCGDYAYYALLNSCEFDYAWLIEPDVCFLETSAGEFLGAFSSSRADLIATDVRPAGDWPFSYQLTCRGVADPWRCFFPVTRMSREAIASAQELRMRLQWIDGGNFGPPNDEGIVATAVAANGLEILDLRVQEPEALEHFHHRPKVDLGSVAAFCDGPTVVHPGLASAAFASDLRRDCLRSAKRDVFARFSRGSFRGAVATLETLSDYALLTERLESLHEGIFGERDAEYRDYDSDYRRRVAGGLPLDVRALLHASRLLARLPASPR